MKKLILSIFAVAVCATSLFAQETTTKKETVIIDVFTMKQMTDTSWSSRQNNANATYRSIVNGIREKVIAAMVKTQRINVIDVTTNSFFQQAASGAASEEALNSMLSGNDVRQAASKEFEAKYAVQAHVTHIGATRNRTDDGKIYYNGEVSVAMKIINLEDGTIAHSKDYAYSGLTAQTGDTEVTAINNTVEYLAVAVPRFIDTAFPVVGQILDILEEKKGEAKTVYINLGSAAGIKEKDKFDVFQVKTIAGKEMRTEIGDLTVSEVGGEDISTCKVSKCGALICQSVANPDKVKILIISRPKSAAAAGMAAFGKSLVK